MFMFLILDELFRLLAPRMDEWRNGEFVRLFPELASQGFGAPPSSQSARLPPTPPTSTGTPSRHLGEPKRVSDDEAEHFLRNPSALIGTRFVHSPPQDEDRGYDEGPWKVASYTVREGDEGVEHEYEVLLEALEGTPLPMDEGEVRYLLQYSAFAQ